jgi:PTH1 family peptidyl-tRNA hydrolase
MPLVLPHLVVGLGNPGSRYAQTRHNIGFDAVDRLCQRWGLTLQEERRFQAEFAEGAVPRLGRVRVLKPLTYMNESGRAIRAVLDWYKLPPESVLVIYDDLDLPLGRLRLRLSGSAGGHNGMKSAIAHLRTQQFPRLRVGIGRAATPGTEGREETVSHVLGRFLPSEQSLMDELLTLIADAVDTCLKDGVELAMNRYNTRNLMVV